jgi:uncharacterized protein (TIGR02246 family)
MTAARDLLQDRADISDLMVKFVQCLDRRDWDAYGNTFAEDGVFEIMGQSRTGRAEIVAGPQRDLVVFGRTQHFSTNHTIELDGDTAISSHYLLAVHVPDAERPERHADIGGQYQCVCVRTVDGWRFAKVALEIWWTAGNTFELQPATEAGAET